MPHDGKDIVEDRGRDAAGPVSSGGTARASSTGKRGSFGWEVIGIALSRVLVRSSHFVSSLVIARLLGPEGRGLVTALTVPCDLAVSVSEMGIRQSTAFHLGRGLIPLERLLPTLLTMIPLVSGLAIAVSLAYFQVTGVARGDPLLQGLAVAAIPFLLATSYASGVFLGKQQIAAFRKTSWRPAFVRLALIVGLGWAAGLGVVGVLAATLAAAATGGAYALYLLTRTHPLRFGFRREVASALQRKGVGYAAAGVLALLNNRLMILLLTQFGTLRDVGIYAQALVIVELLLEIPMVLSALVLSRGVNAKDERAFSLKLMALSRFALLATVCAGLGLAAVAGYAFPLLYGEQFALSAEVCVLLIPGMVALVLFKLLNIDLSARGRLWVALWVLVPMLAVNAGLGYALIASHGVVGAAVATSVTYALAAVAYAIVYAHTTGLGLRAMVLPRRADLDLLRQALPVLRRKATSSRSDA